MELEVQIQKVYSEPVAVVVTRAPRAKITEVLGNAHAAVYEYLQKVGIQPTGPPFCQYRDVGGEEWCIEEGVPVDMPIQEEGAVRSSLLFGGKAATVWHLGSYATLDDTWTALESWAKEHGFIVGDGAWEIYWCGPRDEPDSAKWRTQLFLPVE